MAAEDQPANAAETAEEQVPRSWALSEETLTAISVTRYSWLSVLGAIALGSVIAWLLLLIPSVLAFGVEILEQLQEPDEFDYELGRKMVRGLGIAVLGGGVVGSLIRWLIDREISTRVTRHIAQELDTDFYGSPESETYEFGWLEELDHANGVLYRHINHGNAFGRVWLNLGDGEVTADFKSSSGFFWMLLFFWAMLSPILTL